MPEAASASATRAPRPARGDASRHAPHLSPQSQSQPPSKPDGGRTADGARLRQLVLDAPIDVLGWRQALDTIASWASRRESRMVCICNAHSVVTASSDPGYRAVIEAADMATADGMPVVWMLRRLGFPTQPRLDGPDLMWRYCAEAARRGERIFLYGNTPATLAALEQRLRQAFPSLALVGSISPPFRELSAEEDERIVQRIERSGAQVVFVSLGCPKQERWMHAHLGRIHAVMVGVGAAFDFHAGTVRRAPRWMQASGLEWLHRLCAEPRRLWRRYLVTNSRYVAGAARQLLSRKTASGADATRPPLH
jgi:N-acetylglucosaminyldiphosphoundecaprenol N-acetyl-beta-D-mannosaminyltransferase